MVDPALEIDALKPAWRWRQEEIILMCARGVLLISIIPPLALVLMSMGYLSGLLEAIEDKEAGLAHALQYGALVFLGMELMYYFYLSWSFRRWREWGVGLWALAVIVFLALLYHPID